MRGVDAVIELHAPEAVMVGVAVLLHVSAHAAAVTRDARRRGTHQRSYDLRYPRSWRLSGAAGGAILLLAALLVTGRGSPYEGAARVVLALLGAGATIELLLSRVRVLPDGVERRTAWRRPTFFRWDEVTAVELRLDLGWLTLRTGTGAQLRIANRLEGMNTFAGLALVHLPREALATDPVARDWLAERARGGPV
jgi:hypothetical protein